MLLKNQMTISIEFWGLASQRKVFEKQYLVNYGELPELFSENLLLVARNHWKIPIASTCLAEGICQKCIIHPIGLSCLTTLKKIIDNIIQEQSLEGIKSLNHIQLKFSVDYL